MKFNLVKVKASAMIDVIDVKASEISSAENVRPLI